MGGLFVVLLVSARALACGEQISDSPSPSVPDGGPDGAPLPSLDGSFGGARPSFCDGIILYASFDRGVVAPDVGEVTTEGVGGVAVEDTGGHFGGGVKLVSDAADAGAAVFYLVPDAGPEILPSAQGSVALWHRSTVDALQSRVLYRLVANGPAEPLVPTALVFVRLQNRIGLWETAPTARAVLAIDETVLAPYLREGGYNHFFTAWRLAEDGGLPGPTAWLAINGGLGLVLRDAGLDGYAPAVPDDAGNLPYLSSTNDRWRTGPRPVAFRLGGPAGSATEGSLDDVVVWSRIVSFEEAAAVYAAGRAVGEVCGLAR
jgi:hypothetical protein